MSTESIPKNRVEHESERERESLPIISYSEYREICDNMQPDIYRKTGIASGEEYEAARENPDTVFVEMGGQKLPLFVTLENAGGYNLENSKRLAGRENMFALALPPELIDAENVDIEAYLQELGDDAAVIVQTASGSTQEIKTNLSEKIDRMGWKTGDFLDPRCPKGRQAARISMYATRLDALDENGVLIPYKGRSLEALFVDDVSETAEEDTELITAEVLRNNEELFEQLWELHNDKFDWLGEYHPVSMQETKGFFREVVTNDRTTSYVRFDYEDGKRVPVCHGCFMEGLEEAEWLTDNFRDTIEDTENDQEKIQYFYGIVSKSTTSAHYAKDVMQLHSRLSKRNGGSTKMLFESTNKSSLYIPRMIQAYLGEEHSGTKATEVETISRLDYWYLASDLRESV